MNESDFGESQVPFTESKVSFPPSERIPWERGEFGEDQLIHLTRSILIALATLNETLLRIEKAMSEGRRYR